MSENVLETVFGSGVLKNKAGEVVSIQTLFGKTVGLYFSAHWCPPCRGYTPVLAKKYQEILEAGHSFEVVFVSSDKDEEGYNKYYTEMPWLRLEYSDRQLKEKLAEYFDIQGIPTLILLNGNGQVISAEGVGLIMEAPFDKLAEFEAQRVEEAEMAERETAIIETEARIILDDFLASLPATITSADGTHQLKKNLYIDEDSELSCSVCANQLSSYAYSYAEKNFNAHPQCVLKDGSFRLLDALLGSAAITDKDGGEVTAQSLAGKVVGLYFSAHWCGPCRRYTPKLAEKYTDINSSAAEKKLEIVFLSADECQAGFDTYAATMPWSRLTYSELARNKFLNELFGVSGIPTLLLFDQHGQFVTADGNEASDLPFEEWLNYENAKQNKAIELERLVQSMPDLLLHEAHPHPLKRSKNVYPSGQYGCDICGHGGAAWAYHCAECGFDAHPHCVLNHRPVTEDGDVLSEKLEEVQVTDELGPAAESEMVCDETSCHLRPK